MFAVKYKEAVERAQVNLRECSTKRAVTATIFVVLFLVGCLVLGTKVSLYSSGCPRIQ